MRLADLIVQRGAVRTGHPMDRDWQLWASKLRDADCYAVDASAGQLAQGTTETAPARAAGSNRSSLVLPTATSWFEWAGASASLGARRDAPLRPGTVEPERSGVLIQAMPPDHRLGVMSWVWQMPGGALEACPVSVTFDWRVNPAPVPDMVRAAFATIGQSWEQHLREFHDGSRFKAQPFEPMVAEERRFGHIPCGLLSAFWNMLDVTGQKRPEIAQDILRSAMRDVEAEPVFIMGLLICMGAEGLLSVSEPEPMDRLNAARRKRGREPRLSFRAVAASGKTVIRLSDRGGPIEAASAFHTA